MNSSTPGLPVHHQFPEFAKPYLREFAMDWMFLCLLKIYTLKTNSHCDAIWGWGLKEVIRFGWRHRVGPPWWDWCMGSHQTLNLPASLSCTYWSSELWEIDVCCLSHPVYGIFIFASQAKQTLKLLVTFSLLVWQFLICCCCCSLSHVQLFASTRPPCPSLSPRVCSDSCPLSRWCHPTISSPVSPPSPPTLNLSRHQGLFQWVGFSHQVAKVSAEHQLFGAQPSCGPVLTSVHDNWKNHSFDSVDLCWQRCSIQNIFQQFSNCGFPSSSTDIT